MAFPLKSSMTIQEMCKANREYQDWKKEEAEKIEKLQQSRKRLGKVREAVSMGANATDQGVWDRMTGFVMTLKTRRSKAKEK